MKAELRLLIAAAAGFVLSIAAPARSAEDFFKSKTIRFVVGQAAGGGYDLAARTIARHMGKHIPGNPTIVVENMTGAGSLIAANYTYNSAKPDGLFVGTWNGALILRQALGDKSVRLGGRKLKVTYASGEQIEKYVDEMLSISPQAKELLSFLVTKPKK